METSGLFDWDEANTSHIARHAVTKQETEQVLLSDPFEGDYDPDGNGEQRWTYLGETALGRILTVIVTMRGQKMRVVTAYDAEKQDKILYLETRAGWYDDGTDDSQI
ncbi:MAG TPA: BrnT family toxin [Acidobacteriaceae bacterium]